jgi:hypothetical protein
MSDGSRKGLSDLVVVCMYMVFGAGGICFSFVFLE